jgi:hypothetical protein
MTFPIQKGEIILPWDYVCLHNGYIIKATLRIAKIDPYVFQVNPYKMLVSEDRKTLVIDNGIR